MKLLLPLTSYQADSSTAVRSDELFGWAEKHGVIKAGRMKKILLTTQISKFAEHAYPFADHDQRLLADCWCLWTLLVDELFEELLDSGRVKDLASESADPFAALLAAGDVCGANVTALHAALEDLWQRTAPDTSSQWQQSFLNHVTVFIDSCHLEALHRNKKAYLSLDEFTELRRGSFATALFLELVEKFESTASPRGGQIADIRQRMCQCAADVGGWCNDVLSYQREASNNEIHNLVLILARDLDCPLELAVDASMGAIRDRAWEFLSLRADLITALRKRGVADADAASVLRWANAVESLVSGSLTFQLISNRWQESAAPSTGQSSAR